MRNLSEACKTCKDNQYSLAMCFDICGVPYDLLEEIEDNRNKEKENNVPTVEAIPKVNVYKAIQEMMKYEHEGFINISLIHLDEILKKCGVSENGNDN